MGKNKQILDVYFVSTENYTIRKEQFDGKSFIVVPVTMMVEGVHSGSHGPVLHLAEELGKYPQSWDGMPATIGHPFVDGQYVSANSPSILNDWAVGRIFNTQMVNTSLKAEAWLDEVNLERISEDTLNRLNNGEVIEVSVGIFSDSETTSGIWNNVKYEAIARNHRPNHLALLPDEVGACSIADGCGIRVNSKKTTKVTDIKTIVNSDNQSQVVRELSRLGFVVNEVGHNELSSSIANIVYGFDGNSLDHYLEEVYSDYFVYQQSNYRVDPRVRKLFKQSYSIDSANNVVLNGEPIHVKREITYTPILNANGVDVATTERIIKKNSRKTMCTDCVKKLADSLINNKATAWSEADREYLETQTEEHLEKMTPPTAEVKTNTVTPTREELLAVFSAKPMTNEEFLGLASPEVRSQIEEGLALRVNQKTELVSQIAANAEQWSEDELNTKELSELQKIHKIVMKDESQTVYSGGGGLGGRTKIETNGKKPTTIMLPKGVE